MERLQQALALLRYADPLEPWHRNNLVAAISEFALVNHDSELQTVCEQEFERIRATSPPDRWAPRRKWRVLSWPAVPHGSPHGAYDLQAKGACRCRREAIERDAERCIPPHTGYDAIGCRANARPTRVRAISQ